MRCLIRTDDHVEALLTPEGRAALPLRRQLLLYFDPFALFKDASCGSAWARHSRLTYNYRHRHVLLTSLRRWLLIATCLYFGIAGGEALAAKSPVLVIPVAGFGVACALAVAMAAWISAAYVLLGAQARGS